MISRTNIALAVLLVVVVVLATMIRVDYSKPNYEFLPEMKYSPAASAFAENDNFPNGQTLQTPVPGTIARGAMPLHYTASKEDALRAGEKLQNPFKQESEPQKQRLRLSVQGGGDVYRAFCTCCHGPGGGGDGPVAKRGFPPPPSLLTGKSLKMKDGQLFHILAYGQGNMSPMAGQLSREQRWDVINYIRDLQKDAPTTKP